MIARIALAVLLPALFQEAFAESPDYDAMTAGVRSTLTELVEADTTNPPGNEARAVEIAAGRLKAAGLTYEITEFDPGRKNITARLKGAGPGRPLLLLAHTDVVGTEGQPWATEPHKIVEQDGYLKARGVSDDLGMAAIELETFLTLAKRKTALKRDVILAWTGNEESGGDGIRYLLKNRPETVEAEIALNEGGGPVLGEEGKVKYVGVQAAEKVYQDFEVSTEGETGHSAVPLKDNAIYRLAQALARLSKADLPPSLLPVIRGYLENRAALEPKDLAQAMISLARSKGKPPQKALALWDFDPARAALVRTTCVPTLLKAGTRANALPAEAQARINCRLLPGDSAESVRDRLAAAIADPLVKIRALKSSGPSPASPVEGPFFDALRKVSGEMWPGVPVIPGISSGASDSRYLRAAGILAYGIKPMPLTEGDGRKSHGVEERVPVASFRLGVEFFHRLVLELAGA